MNGWMDEGVSSNAPLLSASGSTADFLADLQAGSVHTSFLSSDGALYTCKLLIVLHCHIDIICLSISACLSVCLSHILALTQLTVLMLPLQRHAYSTLPLHAPFRW